MEERTSSSSSSIAVQLCRGNGHHKGVFGAQGRKRLGCTEDVDRGRQRDAGEAPCVDAGAAQARRFVGRSSEQLNDRGGASLALLLAPQEREGGPPCTGAENADSAHAREAGFAFAGACFVDFEERPRSRPSSASRSRTTIRIGVPIRGYFSRI